VADINGVRVPGKTGGHLVSGHPITSESVSRIFRWPAMLVSEAVNTL
jgi:hypothetical protein